MDHTSRYTTQKWFTTSDLKFWRSFERSKLFYFLNYSWCRKFTSGVVCLYLPITKYFLVVSYTDSYSFTEPLWHGPFHMHSHVLLCVSFYISWGYLDDLTLVTLVLFENVFYSGIWKPFSYFIGIWNIDLWKGKS